MYENFKVKFHHASLPSPNQPGVNLCGPKKSQNEYQAPHWAWHLNLSVHINASDASSRQRRHYVSGRPSGRCPSVNTYFARHDIFALSGGISTKLDTHIHNVSGHCWKRFQGQRSKVICVQMYRCTLCSIKSDAKIEITITTAYLIRIKCPLSGFNYHLSDVNVANFNKIHRTVSEHQLF